jgi:hypothetical protein
MFSEATKLAVKRRAHFACCLCHDIGVEVHHIVPQGEGGTDEPDNAAPLCPSCHERYGANSTKRRFIREAREFWYEICSKRFASDVDRLSELEQALSGVATKADLDAAVQALIVARGPEQADVASELPPDLANQPISGGSIRLYLRWMYPTLSHCGGECCAHLAADLDAVGYPTLADVHEVLAESKQAVSEFVQDHRDRGEFIDRLTDSFPLELLLAVLDERYCRLRRPKVYAKIASDYPWRRRAAQS